MATRNTLLESRELNEEENQEKHACWSMNPFMDHFCLFPPSQARMMQHNQMDACKNPLNALMAANRRSTHTPR